MSPLDKFARVLGGDGVPERVRAALIGDTARIDGPFGPKPLIYADYVASGRALSFVEDFVRDDILPYYSNTHTQASYCGAYMTRLREAARAEIARLVGADEATSVVFSGAGTTAGLNRLVSLLGVPEAVARGERVVVLIGPYEHHSNILPWRESGAEVIEIEEAATGGVNLSHLESVLAGLRDGPADLLVGSFSAASNVTGIKVDVDAVTRMLRRYGAVALWDYGCAAPYTEMDMRAGTDAQKDAIVFSPHKFPGGPGASGVAVIRDAIVRRTTPTKSGGGTVSFVSPWTHVYSRRLADREEAGTPNSIGDIRACLVMLVKEALGQRWLDERQGALRRMAMDVWSANPAIRLLGVATEDALPIFSFQIRDGRGGYVHHQLFTRMLSDLHGVQARGGCSCAGPYGHRLLDISQAESAAIAGAIARGEETEKPGWVRLNLSPLLSDEKARTIVQAVDSLAREAPRRRADYTVNTSTAQFQHVGERQTDEEQETL
ncbi:aminotransferase class V-fold PLP-dependent enzyme [Psychromarinibacter sp. C21-152]|uniref:Aminotransferase class V-fold PLP-dependent enzyme n=1 Tax=Psychromarinibacter sediminicola TaxID=3033385 RepID=A0AAE3TB71_9RHOB|nr:aminotransferase class V-fold PLP-dependent enzyme [Psychromarinibacter sediminicola]MDF0603533.1 aminotransferase class V-fold PLP-dependent enzyme [Psychromarinibacter sediminicola]